MKSKETNSVNRSIYDRSWDLLSEMWLDAEAKKIADELEKDKAAGRTSEMDAFFAQYDAKNHRTIQKCMAQRRRRKFIRQTLPRAIQVAAMVCFVSFVLGSIILTASASARSFLANLLIKVTPQYTSFQFVEVLSESMIKPDSWYGKYYPSYIPRGYTVQEVNSSEAMHYVVFMHSNGSTLEFSESTDGTINMDTENSVSHPAQVGDLEGTVIVKNDRISVYWNTESTLFILSGTSGSEQEILKIAESVRQL